MASISATTTPASSGGASAVTLPTSMPAFVSRSAASFGVSRRSTNSKIHLYGIFMAAPRARTGGASQPRPVSPATRRPDVPSSRELPQEPQIVLEEHANVVDPVLEHGDALDSHPEGPAGHRLGIVSPVLQHGRMYHAGPQDFEPARLLADAAARPVAQEAAHVDLGRRLGE